MHPRILARGAALGLLTIALAACGGGSGNDAYPALDADPPTTVASANPAQAADPSRRRGSFRGPARPRRR